MIQSYYSDMTIKQIATILDGRIICGEERQNENQDYAFASDLMSDVLTLGDNTPIIVTGLCTVQTIRTCEMGNLGVIIFVRKKKASQEMIELAQDNGMVLIECDYSMFKSCGILYQNGLKPIY
jgi:DRTGG domain.